uniref:Lon proteolytic domain-containing protein n=1 Tax=viral metagenome TaxID=1070528 RepID=A0A6C0D6Z2_9ZZZZ
MNKNQVIKKQVEIVNLVEKKIEFFRDVIQKTVVNCQKNKMLDVLGITDVTTCINKLNNISEMITEFNENVEKNSTDYNINRLQTINNELSVLLKNYGTDLFEDLLTICFGNNNSFFKNNEDIDKDKYELLKKHFHPTEYKVINLKKGENDKLKTTSFYDEQIAENTKNLDCSDININSKHFHLRVYGIKVYINHIDFNKHLVIYGILDDIMISYLNNKYINKKIENVQNIKPNDINFAGDCFDKYVKSLTLKDFLMLSPNDIINKYVGYITQIKILKQKNLTNLVKDFIGSDLFSKRNILMQLLIGSNNYENKYLAYLLYDLLSNDTNGTVDTVEQTILFDSFPWSVKQLFKEAMKKTIQYTNDLSNFDINKIPLEQQICLMKTNDIVKEKAMSKLKEIKAKSEDSGSKARQYLDGLLKIPFNVYKKEPIMYLMDENRKMILEILSDEYVKKYTNFDKLKKKHASIEIISILKNIKTTIVDTYGDDLLNNLKKKVNNFDKSELISYISKLNYLIGDKKLNYQSIQYAKKLKKELLKGVYNFLDYCKLNHKELLLEMNSNIKLSVNATNNIKMIETNFDKISDYMQNVKKLLDDSVHGHDKAKRQIERIIGQWINGEQDGYCFGFEGPPGVGKTTLAKKGLSSCLLDENGESRPFAMIQMGGDANGSSLHGHNYTYVGSTWGGIVQILIDKKCMNPIVLIDELDKISKTEHGREIVGILTHLLDPTQNDCFQDKYFSGIDLDLSKALFILSYNDVDSIDKILLDRIHRIKFSTLSLDDKLTIAKTHMLPDVYKKMGLEDIIIISDDVLKYIIEEYTSEPGVRKLKEIIFEIVGEINLDILKNCACDYPINISIEDIKTKYFKDKRVLNHKKIHIESMVGIMNGLWANAVGHGGFLPIQAKFFPGDSFLSLKLTGMQGETMKESMNVALTLAWNLTSEENKDTIRNLYQKNNQGIHIHTPEGSIQKDGPSAGTAISVAIFSLLNNRKIKNTIAITGEIELSGNVTEIGGLDLKLLGGIKGGVKEFIYPVDNEKDYKTFMEKYKETDLIKDIKFYPVNNIHEVFELVFEE